MDGMEALHNRVSAMLKQFGAVVQERDALRRELRKLRSEHEELQNRLARSEEALLALQIGKSIPDEELRSRSRRKLDEVITEIDKILMTLND